ncbi:MAG: hypothetical protein IJ486_00145 [Firmicutes bacterium]|nr:hypothetical protein [Bacillota bacterium]
MEKKMNRTRGEIFKHSILAAVGLISFGIGCYISIQANIGVAPWDTFTLGLSGTLGVQYGTASIAMSLIVLTVDLLLRERIGVGTLLDAFIVGKTVDFCNWLDFIPKQDNMIVGIVMMFVALTIMGFSQYLYMTAALSCGPRDSLIVALGRRMKKVPIGFVSTTILVVVLAIGWRLGGPVGIGTLIAAIFQGPLMQFAFNVMKFDATSVKHQDLVTSVKVLTGRV